MPRVFIINQPTAERSPTGRAYNVKPAAKYGELVFIFRGDEPTPASNPQKAIEKAHSILADITEEDFIVWAGGDPMGAVVVSAVASFLLHGKVRYLAWQRARTLDDGTKQFGYYEPVLLDMNGGQNV